MNPTSPVIALTVPRQTAHLALVRQVVVAAARRLEFDDGEVAKIELATDEACANAVVHGAADGPPTFDLTIEAREDELVITLRDGAPPFTFEEQGQFELAAKLAEPTSGGLGVYIMRSFMDDVTYAANEHGSVTTLRKRRARAEALVTAGGPASRRGSV